MKHYTGTPAEDFRPYILFTNYIRYVDEFVTWALGELKREDSPYEALSVAGGVLVTRETPDPEAAAAELERAVTQLGFKGAMIYGLTHGAFTDEKRFW